MPEFLFEGLEGAFFPEVAYVRQGDRVHFFKGESSLTESLNPADVKIVESFDALELEERQVNGNTVKTVKDGRWFVEGPYQRSDVKNANGRSYPRGIWEKWVADEKSQLMTSLREGGVIGHLEHPRDGRTDGKEGAIVLRSLRLREDGVVWGKSEVLDTPNGLILQEYTRKGVRWGVSSRGTGTVDSKGQVNEADYVPETWDAVMRPSVQGAYSTPVGTKKTESVEDPEELSESAKKVIADVKSLCETDISTLDEAGVLSHQHALVNALVSVSDAVDSGLSPDKAASLDRWLAQKLKAIGESVVKNYDAQLEAALDESLSTSDNQEAFTRIVDRLRSRLAEAVNDAEAARKELKSAQAQLAEAQEQQNVLREMQAEAVESLEAMRDRLRIAEDMLSEQSVQMEADAVNTAVASVLDRIPELASREQQLREAQTTEEVEALVEELIPAVLEERHRAAGTAVLRTRSTLPKSGATILESRSVPSRTLATNLSRGARTACKVVQSMKR